MRAREVRLRDYEAVSRAKKITLNSQFKLSPVKRKEIHVGTAVPFKVINSVT